MSLSRILNNDSEPPVPAFAASRAAADAPAISNMRPRRSTTSPRRSPSRPPAEPPHAAYHHTPSYEGHGGYDPYPGEHGQGGAYMHGQGTDHYRQRVHTQAPVDDEEASEEEAYGGRRNGDGAGRKKKRTQDDDDYQPATRRVSGPGSRAMDGLDMLTGVCVQSTRRTSLKAKQQQQQQRPPSPPSHVRQLAPEPYQPTEEERRLASSDLDDCEEIWVAELSDYMLETRKRQKQVESWFEVSCLVRSSTPVVLSQAHRLSY
jgi:chromatin-remodeling ATPase INO80